MSPTAGPGRPGLGQRPPVKSSTPEGCDCVGGQEPNHSPEGSPGPALWRGTSFNLEPPSLLWNIRRQRKGLGEKRELFPEDENYKWRGLWAFTSLTSPSHSASVSICLHVNSD